MRKVKPCCKTKRSTTEMWRITNTYLEHLNVNVNNSHSHLSMNGNRCAVLQAVLLFTLAPTVHLDL